MPPDVPRSANGWTANDRSVIASYSLPGGKVALRKGDVSVVLLWCANRWHETVEPLVWPGNWGYAERLVRGSATSISDHASGTALDLNAPQHPLGVTVARTFSTLEVRAVRAILEYCEGAVGWGGDYRSRPDGMHLFIRTNADGVKRVADKIRAAARPPVAKRITINPDQSMTFYPATLPLFPTREDAMLIKTQPDKTKPVVLTALLSGPMFIGLGPTETPSDEQARQMGLPIMWVELATWQDMDRRSHNLCDRPMQVVTQSPVVRAPMVTGNNPVNVVASSPNSPSSAK